MWTSKLYIDPAHIAHADDAKYAKYVSYFSPHNKCPVTLVSAFARIENHYFVNEVRQAL